MIHLILQNSVFQLIRDDFEQWLFILGYSGSSVTQLPIHVKEFLHFLEQHDISDLSRLREDHFVDFYQHVRSRGNQRRGGGLSNAYLNKHKQALDRFADFLRKKEVVHLPRLPIQSEEIVTCAPDYLSRQEIKWLFEATDDFYYPSLTNQLTLLDLEAYAARDKAMLTVFYSCGLRRSEGEKLNVADIDLDRRIVCVRQGKGAKDRLVPFTKQSRTLLRDYLYDYRPELLKGVPERALFISQRKKRMQGQTMAFRLRVLQQRCDDPVFRQKNLHLHLLRHSIATHLLQNGMSLERISDFLGHQSQDSTQVYTHLAEEQDRG